MIKYIIILSQLFVFLSTSCLKATNTDSLIRRADEMFNQQELDYAALEYERIIFNSSDKVVINRLLLKKSYCSKISGNYHEALQSLSRVDYQFVPKLFRDTILYERALNYYLLSENNNAESILLQLNNQGVNFSTYLYLILLNDEARWVESKELYSKYVNYYHLPEKDADIYSFLNDLKLKKGRLAQGLSYVIPGLGQLYLKKPKEAFFSFTFTALTGYFVVSSFVGAYYVASIGTGLPYFLRFYFGGQNSVKKIINERNKITINQINTVLNARIIKINNTIGQ